jgi:uncharacterized repeat protein (TIGR03803 family)
MTRHFSTFFAVCVTLFTLANVVPTSAQTESVIVEFQYNTTTGAYPLGALAPGENGTLFGTTSVGVDCGTVFKLTPPVAQGGAWKYNLLYSFTCVEDGASPTGSLLLGKAGKIYGTTQNGSGSGYDSTGVVYELTPPEEPGSPWTETVLHKFSGGTDGGNPTNGVIADGEGKLYGTTRLGGKFGYGTVFRLSPPAQVGGVWEETVLYNFQLQEDSGSYPDPTGLVMSASGSLYGATSATTRYNVGTVFELSPPSSGKGNWALNVLYEFSGGADGGQPSGSMVFDSSGALYGTALEGGSLENGAIYKLTPPTTQGGAWTESVLYSFQGQGVGDGYDPVGTPAFDSTGAIYGVTESGGIESCGGNDSGCGIAYKLSPPVSQGGEWTEQVLHAFTGGSDGDYPPAGVAVVGTDVYGTTIWGGTGPCQENAAPVGCGTVFQITQ